MPFSEKVKIDLSNYSGGFCSAPDCVTYTGIKINPTVPSIGEAAHIVAEMPSGPRGDSPLSPEERNQLDNGIWLCPSCHTKIDGPRWQEFSVLLLKEWKQAAHTRHKNSIGKTPLEIGLPNVREQRSLPDAASLQAAIAFQALHFPLANALSQLRFNYGHLYKCQLELAQDIEALIVQLSSRPSVAESWQTSWNTTYRCVDQELYNLMVALITAVTALLPAYGLRESRIVEFSPPNDLAQLIFVYLDTFDALRSSIARYTAF